ncbi:MAG: aldo/keto reductase [SAR202 cluster bacterium]|nr:aldo/keto reductase [SAR202 cluster bacterium]
MELCAIPKTELKVSPLCLGTMMFGNPVVESDAIRIVHWALDTGINFIDTADMYEGYDRFLGSPGGVSEEILGKAIRNRRDHAVITTKVGNSIGDKNYKGTGLGSVHILHQIDQSLRRLQTDYVDIYEMHIADPDTPIQDSIAVMDQLIDQGKVRHWGFSNFTASQIHEIVTHCDSNGWRRPVVSQPSLSWLDRDSEDAYIPACMEYEIAATPYRTLEAGLLTGKYQRGIPAPPNSRAVELPSSVSFNDGIYDGIKAFEREAREANLQPVQYAVKWVFERPGVYSVIVGAKRIDQLEPLIDILH